MKRFIIAVLLLLTTMNLPVSAQAESLNVGVSASTACDQKRVRIDWTVTNLEDKTIKITVKDAKHNKTSPQINATPNETLTSSFRTGAKSTEDSTLKFVIVESGSEKTHNKTAEYSAKVCTEESSENDEEDDTDPTLAAADSNLPNTGPLDGIAVYVALTLATGSAWLVTRKELADALKS